MPIHPVNRPDLHPDQRGTYNADEVYERVYYWQHMLGLDNWLLHVWLLPSYNQEGYTQRYLGEMEAIVRLREDARIGDLERTIVHELLHIVTGPWKDAYVAVLKTLPTEQYDLAFSVINEQEENVIERLSEYYIRVAGGDWWGGRPIALFEPTDPDSLKKLTKYTSKPEKSAKNEPKAAKSTKIEPLDAKIESESR